MEIRDYILALEQRAKAAAPEMNCASHERRRAVLARAASLLRAKKEPCSKPTGRISQRPRKTACRRRCSTVFC